MIRILVLIKFQEFLVSLQSGLGLVQLIVANRADKPDARSGLFHFGYLVHGRQCSGLIPSQDKGGAEVFEVSQILWIEMERGSQFFFCGSEVAVLQIDSSKAAMQLRVVGS